MKCTPLGTRGKKKGWGGGEGTAYKKKGFLGWRVGRAFRKEPLRATFVHFRRGGKLLQIIHRKKPTRRIRGRKRQIEKFGQSLHPGRGKTSIEAKKAPSRSASQGTRRPPKHSPAKTKTAHRTAGKTNGGFGLTCKPRREAWSPTTRVSRGAAEEKSRGGGTPDPPKEG